MFGRELPGPTRPTCYSSPRRLHGSQALALWSLLTAPIWRHAVLQDRRPHKFHLRNRVSRCGVVDRRTQIADRRPVLAGVLFGLASISSACLFRSLCLRRALGARWRAPVSPSAFSEVFGWEAWRAYVNVTAPFQTGIGERHRPLMMPSAFMGAPHRVGRRGRILGSNPIHIAATGATYWAFCGQVPKTIVCGCCRRQSQRPFTTTDIDQPCDPDSARVRATGAANGWSGCWSGP